MTFSEYQEKTIKKLRQIDLSQYRTINEDGHVNLWLEFDLVLHHIANRMDEDLVKKYETTLASSEGKFPDWEPCHGDVVDMIERYANNVALTRLQNLF